MTSEQVFVNICECERRRAAQYGEQKRKTNTKGAKKNIDRFVPFASLPLRFLCSQSLNLIQVLS